MAQFEKIQMNRSEFKLCRAGHWEDFSGLTLRAQWHFNDCVADIMQGSTSDEELKFGYGNLVGVCEQKNFFRLFGKSPPSPPPSQYITALHACTQITRTASLLAINVSMACCDP